MSLSLHRIPELGNLDSFAALRLWVDSYIEREEVCRGGCSYGSLAGEIIKTETGVRHDLAVGFDRWECVSAVNSRRLPTPSS